MIEYFFWFLVVCMAFVVGIITGLTLIVIFIFANDVRRNSTSITEVMITACKGVEDWRDVIAKDARDSKRRQP